MSKCFWGRDAPPVGDLVLAGDVLYKRALVEPFLDALEAALAPGGRALLCHLPRAGVSHEVVEAALRAREAAGGPALAASARRHLPSSATTAPPTTRRRRASTRCSPAAATTRPRVRAESGESRRLVRGPDEIGAAALRSFIVPARRYCLNDEGASGGRCGPVGGSRDGARVARTRRSG